MSAILDILREMKPHPAMYLGSPSVSKLAFFPRGYDAALMRFAPDRHDRFLADFRDHVQALHGNTRTAWEQILLEKAGDESRGLDLFWQILGDFEKARAEDSDRFNPPSNPGQAQSPALKGVAS